jgi:hypothetical protein
VEEEEDKRAGEVSRKSELAEFPPVPSCFSDNDDEVKLEVITDRTKEISS